MTGSSESQIWRRSRTCDSSNCVEVTQLGPEIAVRDSKNPAGAVLRFTKAEWDSFVAGVRMGDFQFE